MSRSGFRKDRVFCNCDRYDMPHRYDPPKCPPGFNSEDILRDQGRDPLPAKAPVVQSGWRCSWVDSQGRMCGTVNPHTKQRCLKCGR